MTLDRELFGYFSDRIAALPNCANYTKADLLVSAFQLKLEGSLAIYYAPFDHVKPEARGVLVGTTPGWTQMEIGYREARLALLDSKPMDEVCRCAKARASFAGPMRRNLVTMLDGIGLDRALALATCEALFDAAALRVHMTSTIRYPVFIDGENWTGHRPELLHTPILRDMSRAFLAEELRQILDALVIPLGAVARMAVEDLAKRGVVESDRILDGFPHPSGANGHRRRLFAERQAELSYSVGRWFEQITPVA